jgi:hypothetical protein
MISTTINRGSQKINLSNNAQLSLNVYEKVSVDTIVDVLAKSVAYNKVFGSELPNQVDTKVKSQLTRVTL